RLIEKYPQEDEAYHQRAHVHARLGQWEQAIADHSQAIALAPHYPEHLACRGRTYFRAGLKDKAAEDFRNAGARKAELANLLAWELATAPIPRDREPRLAVDLAKQAIGQARTEAMYWNTLGLAHYRAREWAAAVSALEESEKLAPGKYFGFN